jgi:hypothetical protein
VINAALADAATALTETAEVLEPAALADLVPLLACGLVMAQRQMLLYLLDTEPDWPWNK